LRRSLIETPSDSSAAALPPSPPARRRLDQALALGVDEVGHALAQHRDEIAHHVLQRAVDAEAVGVQVALGGAEADLAVDAGGEIVLGHRLDGGLALGRVPGQVDGLGGDVHLVHLLPGPFEVGAAGADGAHQRVLVACLFVGVQARVLHQVVTDPLGAAEGGQHRALVGFDDNR
jgi:hypothetical protein